MSASVGGVQSTSGGDVINVHNAELYVEAMQSADWSLTAAQRKAREARLQEEQNLKRSKAAAAAASSSSSIGGGQFPHNKSTAQVDALAGKRAVLEAEFRAKMDIAKRESDRRVHERTLRQERQFEDRYADFMAKNKEIVSASKMHEEVSLVRERKRERLYQEWMNKVFLPMQNDINKKIESANTEDIIAFRNQQYQAYLDECNRTKKHGGFIHRDVIVETQYNPFVVNGAATVKYASAGLVEDPLKNRITRESQHPGGANSKLGASSSSSLGAFGASGVSLNNNNDTRRSSVVGRVAAGSASLSARFGANHNSYAQSHAHASKFALLPSDALGTAGGMGGSTASGDYGNAFGASSASVGSNTNSPRPRGPRLLPAVGGVTLNVTTNTIGNTTMNGQGPVATSSTAVLANNDAPYKYSANNSLFNASKESVPLRGAFVDVKQWGRMDATPHGRYSDDNVGPTGRPRVQAPGQNQEFMRSAVVFDHYNMPRGAEGVQQAKAEMVGIGKGKRCGVFTDKSTANPLS